MNYGHLVRLSVHSEMTSHPRSVVSAGKVPKAASCTVSTVRRLSPREYIYTYNFALLRGFCTCASCSSNFVNAYWNSREKSFQRHVFDLMTSWAVRLTSSKIARGVCHHIAEIYVEFPKEWKCVPSPGALWWGAIYSRSTNLRCLLSKHSKRGVLDNGRMWFALIILKNRTFVWGLVGDPQKHSVT